MTLPLHEGTLLNNRYLIENVLRREGTYTLYLARHILLDTHVLVKEVEEDFSETFPHQDAAPYADEERLLVNLRHPSLPQVLDSFSAETHSYVVLEYFEGLTLDAMLRERGGKPLDVAQMISWGIQVAEVLHFLHMQHPPLFLRELDASKILVGSDGSIRLTDFQLARDVPTKADDDTVRLDSIWLAIAKDDSASPSGPDTNIFAFGATLYHLLTGRPLSTRLFKAVPARNINPAIPVSLSKLVGRCISEKPQERPASMGEVLRALEQITDESLAATQIVLAASARPGEALALESHPRASEASRPHASAVVSTEGAWNRGVKSSLDPDALLMQHEALQQKVEARRRGNAQRLAGMAVVGVLMVGGLFYSLLREGDNGARERREPAPRATTGPAPAPSPGPDVSPSPSSQPPAAYVLLRPAGRFADTLEYGWERLDAPDTAPDPLPAPDAQGIIRLGVPADYLQTDARLWVRNRADRRVAHFSLAEVAERHQQAREAAINGPNLLGNGDFRDKNQGWRLEAKPLPARLKFRKVEPILASTGVRGHIATIGLGTADARKGPASLTHSHLFLSDGGAYRLRFWARADRAREIGLVTQLDTPAGGASGLDTRTSLSARWQQFDLPFTISTPVSQRQKQFVVFRFVPATAVQKVSLVGAFNGWNLKANPMSLLSDGKTWQVSIPLATGEYQYKFFADGNWFTDPNAPEINDGSGNMNSVRRVAAHADRHRLRFLLGPSAGQIHLAEVALYPDAKTIQKRVPEDNTMEVTLKASDFSPAEGTSLP